MYKKLLLVFLFIPFFGMAQHTITAEFSPKEDFDYLILYRVEPTKYFYTTDSNKDENGLFNFKIDSTQPAGMYKVVYGIPQEQMNFDVIYNGQEDIELSFSREKGVSFSTSEENKLLASYEEQQYRLQNELFEAYQAEPIDQAAIMVLFTEQGLLQKEFEKQTDYEIASTFIKANSLYIPKKYEDFAAYIKNRKKHYFKHIDFSNPRLQKSTFLVDNAVGYIQGFVNIDNPEESYKENIDALAKQLENTSITYKKTLLHAVWMRLNDASLYKASIYLADAYLIPAAKMDKDTAMVNRVFKFRNITIGSVAPNFSWPISENGKEKTQWLSDVEKAERYVLIFWSSGCSHCLAEIPKIHTSVADISKEQLKVIAIGLEEDQYQWKNTILDLPNFTHVLGLGKWENDIANTYDISSTPTYFVLDSKKQIIAKPANIVELMKIISAKK